MPQPSEFQLQKAFYQWCVGWPDKDGRPTKPPALLPGVECWHTPNGGSRSAREGKTLKEMGVTPGIHDLLFLRPTDFGALGTWGLLFGLEWKEPGKGRLSASQLAMHPRLMRAGMAASVVVDNLKDARDWAFQNLLTIRF